MAWRVLANSSLSSLRSRARPRSAVSRKTIVRVMPGCRRRPVERSVKIGEAGPRAPGSFVRQVRGQRSSVLELSKIVDADQRGDGLAMLADRHGAVAVASFGD